MKKRFDGMSVRGLISIFIGLLGVVYNLWILDQGEPFALAISGVFVLIGLLLLFGLEEHQ